MQIVIKMFKFYNINTIINAIFQNSEEIDEHRKATKSQRKEYHDNFAKIKKLKSS